MAKAPTKDDEASAATSAEDYKTEQEKSKTKDPVDPPKELGPKADLNTLSPKEPYPSGKPAAEPKAGVPMNQAPPEEA